MNIQSLLTPSKGALADLVLSVDPANPDQLQLYWGTALLMVVPRDRDSLLFRTTAGLLGALNLNMTSLEECLGVTGKTLRKWRDALLAGDWEPLAAVFHGPGAEAKLSPDVERYVRRRYRDEIEKHGKTPHGFRLELLSELSHYWEVEFSGEGLRRIFRDEDSRLGRVPSVPALEPAPNAAAEIQAESDAESSASERAAAENGETTLVEAKKAPSGKDREEGCAFSAPSGGNGEQTRNLSPENDATSSPQYSYGKGNDNDVPPPPLFRPNAKPGAALSQHAGLLMFSPWFEQAFGNARPIIRQTAAQILLGAVNQEQSKHIDFEGLGLITEQAVCDIDYQHEQLAKILDEPNLMGVFARNADLLNLKNKLVFYIDPHHKEYTGIEKILLAWSGKHHDVRKGILMDFIHSIEGNPCFVSHFDNYYDARYRCLLNIERFRPLFGEDASGFTWIQDRGYWGRWFLDWIAESGDFFIQWEKDYKNDGWEQSFRRGGKFSIIRKRNDRADRVKVKVHWREQAWPDIAGGRRLIARIKRRGAESLKVAIVTNQPEFSAEKVIKLMLGRWLQETDFTYLTRHFGIGELGGRLFDKYADIAPTLEDRPMRSPQHKEASKQWQKLRDSLGKEFLALNNLPSVSLEQLEEERETVRAKATALGDELEKLKAGEVSDKQLGTLSKHIANLTQKLARIRKDRSAAEKRAGVEARIAALQEELAEAEQRLSLINRTTSRLLLLIEEQYVRPNFRKKAMLDAIRITCRNVFRQPFDIFRPIYDNRRDDHEVLRQLSRSAGVVVRHRDRVDIYLIPALHRQPAQWKRIQAFVDICEHRIRQAFGVKVRFLLNKTDKQIFTAIMRAQANSEAA